MGRPPGSFEGFRTLAALIADDTPSDAWRDQPVYAAHVVALGLTGLTREQLPHIDSVARSTFNSVFINALAAGLWNLCGRPVVTLGHRTAAACAMTRMYAHDAGEHVRAPWDAFVVRLPSPLLTIDDDAVARDANTLLVVCLPEDRAGQGSGDPSKRRWWFKLTADTPRPRVDADGQHRLTLMGSGLALWGFNIETSRLLEDQHGEPIDGDDSERWQRWDHMKVSTADARTDLMARYLTLNVCLYIDSPNAPERERPADIVVTRQTSKPDAIGPSYVNHHVSAGIQLNLCDAVRSYIKTGKMTSGAFARLVTPHWKRVAWGEKHSRRRLQYIDAYWRGNITP